ncbi:hypothetical protein [Pelomicrobium methylotrophicum]|uniref:Uncharacterized protein n=1 Tax=Pelomicrobium methylotrophicum TaxID=2602750 RepID=A0A5C7EJP5_9PROT|nr:hypothetical protein [Pelomicrobium methylotrophicum]TXF11570.1 hypothetical protein FR698_09530 [Pelomicrobium methylotrophicum]
MRKQKVRKKNSWRHKLATARPVLLSALFGWCGADRVMLGRQGAEQMALMLVVASVGLALVAMGGPYHSFGAALFFAAGAYVLYGWWFSVEWSIEEMQRPPSDKSGLHELEIVEYGPVCGRYRNKPIWAWVRAKTGEVLEFKETLGGRSVTEVFEEANARGESVVVATNPGLVYRIVTNGRGRKRVAGKRPARQMIMDKCGEEDAV